MKDVTAEVKTGDIDGELLPITKCVCGKTFDPWTQAMAIGSHWECPKCHRKLTFTFKLTVLEV
jgi:hypothetical protein